MFREFASLMADNWFQPFVCSRFYSYGIPYSQVQEIKFCKHIERFTTYHQIQKRQFSHMYYEDSTLLLSMTKSWRANTSAYTQQNKINFVSF